MKNHIVRGKVYFKTSPLLLAIVYLMLAVNVTAFIVSIFKLGSPSYGDYGINLLASFILALFFTIAHFNFKDTYSSRLLLFLLASFFIFPILVFLVAVNSGLPYTLYERVKGNDLNRIMNGMGWFFAVVCWMMIVCCLVTFVLFLNAKSEVNFHKMMRNSSLILMIATDGEVLISFLSLLTGTASESETIWLITDGIDQIAMSIITFLLLTYVFIRPSEEKNNLSIK